MDIGIPIPNITPPSGTEAIEETARAADALGFHSVWLAEHVIRPLDAYAAGNDLFTWDLYDPYVTAGFVAAHTKNVKIAFGVLVLPFRNPIVTAKMVATLDQLSHGRVLLGIGVGNAYEYRALGLPWKGSGALTTEYLEAFRALWASETPVFHGNRIHLEGAMFKPRPVQDHIPIWVGGSSDGALRRALHYGDGWHVARLSVEAIRPRVERLREIAADEGRDMSTFTLSLRPMVIFRDEPIPGDDPRLTGKAALPGYPIVGPPEYVAEQLARYQTELGFTHLSVDLYDWWTGMRFDTTSSLNSYLQAIETMATKVMPLLPR